MKGKLREKIRSMLRERGPLSAKQIIESIDPENTPVMREKIRRSISKLCKKGDIVNHPVTYSIKVKRNWYDKPTIPKETTMQKPTVGRMVHYMRYGSPNGEHKPEISPAIITKVINEETGKCALFIMNPNGTYFNETPYSEDPKPGHWSWMPYQKAQHTKQSLV